MKKDNKLLKEAGLEKKGCIERIERLLQINKGKMLSYSYGARRTIYEEVLQFKEDILTFLRRNEEERVGWQKAMVDMDKKAFDRYRVQLQEAEQQLTKLKKEKGKIHGVLNEHIQECEPHNCCGDEIKEELKKV